MVKRGESNEERKKKINNDRFFDVGEEKKEKVTVCEKGEYWYNENVKKRENKNKEEFGRIIGRRKNEEKGKEIHIRFWK